MAVYHGREVNIIALSQSANTDQVTIDSPELGQLRVPISAIEITEKERDDLNKKYNLVYPFTVVKEHKNHKTFKDQRMLPTEEAFAKQAATPAAIQAPVSSVQPVRPGQQLKTNNSPVKPTTVGGASRSL